MILKFDSTCSHQCIFTSDTLFYKQTLDEMAVVCWVYVMGPQFVFDEYFSKHVYTCIYTCMMKKPYR